jgi:peptidyl-tRNA hydrolase, PTH1 family
MALWNTERRGTTVDYLVLGLGNPGAEYARSRHNVGVETVELLAQRCGSKLAASRQRALTCEVTLGGKRVALAFPTTFMNASGEAATLLVKRYGITDPTQIIVVQDELDLAPGLVRIKVGGGLAGHNGLRSLTQHLHTQDYLRVRIGVGKPPSKAAGVNHVLKKIPAAERELLDVAVQVAADAVTMMIEHDAEMAMRDFHARP